MVKNGNLSNKETVLKFFKMWADEYIIGTIAAIAGTITFVYPDHIADGSYLISDV